MKKIAILQPNYIPWKGVFDMIHQVDMFVFLDDVQYTKRDWRNRNIISTPSGSKWVTVPVANATHHRRECKKIFEIEIQDNNWQNEHFNLIHENYKHAKYYKQYEFILEEIYKKHHWRNLSEMDINITKYISSILGIDTKFLSSSSLNVEGTKDDKLIEICKELGATSYLSGPAAKDYINPEKFEKEKIELEYIDYNYPEYKQMNEPFNHYVSILDVLFNCGDEAPYYIWGRSGGQRDDTV